MIKRFILMLFFVLLGYLSFGQDYNSALGARLGIPLSVSYKMFFNEIYSGEATVGYRKNAVFINTSLLMHKGVSEVERLRWYYGGGLGLILENDISSLYVNGAIGIEFTMPKTPVSFSLDWAPVFLLEGQSEFRIEYGALGVKYILAK